MNILTTSENEDFFETLQAELRRSRIKRGFLKITNGGWQKKTGMTEVFDINADNVSHKIFSDGDARVDMYRDGRKLGFLRYSHDEPCGADITLMSQSHFDKVYDEIFL